VKRQEVIEKLKAGGTILYSRGFNTDSFFSGGGGAVDIRTTLWLLRNGLVNEKKSETAHGMSYLTWKEETNV
jgi:hypothetical protein